MIRKTVIAAIVAVFTLTISAGIKADTNEISRYKVDFTYQGIDYQILSETDHTVAVAQPFDIDFPTYDNPPKKVSYVRDDVGSSGFLMSSGLFGAAVVIPPTVFDEDGTAYTVTDLAEYAINWVYMGLLALPHTLERLNNGISSVSLSSLYLPEKIKEITGIRYCQYLKDLHIPSRVETIGDNSLYFCGLKELYFPPALKKIGNGVLAYCDSLTMVVLSNLETMGNDCFRNCSSFTWANLPESLLTMGEGCFNDCPSLELVSLPWSEIDMKGCFNGCPAIKRIEVLAIDPNPFPIRSFLDVDRSACTLAVPVGSEEKYRMAEGWKDFLNIVGDVPSITGMATSAVPDIHFRAFGGKGTISIFNPIQTNIDIFHLNGEKAGSVSAAGVSRLEFPAGVYIVSSPFGSRKVAVN